MWSYHGFAPHHCCCSHGMYVQPPSTAWWPWYAGWQPAWQIPEHEHYHPSIPKELDVDDTTTSASAMVGGVEAAHLSLEYEADSGASSPSITVTITDSSGTAAWNLTNLPAGFQVKREFARVDPGAQLKVQGTQVTAHLRWFEFLS